jgi:hypothetical protein
MEGEQHPKATTANVGQVGSAMTLTESMLEEAALGWFQEGGYAELLGPQLNPASCKASPTTVAKSATVQSRSWLNS